MPSSLDTQRASRSQQSERRDSFSFSRSITREVSDAKKMATASTPTRSQEDAARSSRPPSQASAHLDTTVRFPPPNPLHLFALAEAQELFSHIAAARQITAARALLTAPASQASSFAVLRQSQDGSIVEPAGRAGPRSRRPSPSPTRTNSSRSSARTDPPQKTLAKTVAQLAEQVAAQSAALSVMMQRLETLQPAHPPNRPSCATQPVIASHPPSQVASPTSPHAPPRWSPLDVRARRCAPFFLLSVARTFARS